MTTTEPKWHTCDDDGRYRTHKNFAAAEQYARKTARAGNQVEITRNLHPVARVVIDGANRVWTDVLDEAYA